MNNPGIKMTKNKIVHWRNILPKDVSYMFLVT